MIGELISAGSNLIGGFLNRSESRRQQEANLAAQREMADRNIQLQKDFAQQGVRWKVEDARAAGIHPLYALGASTHSFSPVSVGSSSVDTSSVGNAVAAAGQDIGRAINATRTGGERVDAFQKTVQDLTLQKMGLENQLLASQIRKINQPATPPARPDIMSRYLLPGQGDTLGGQLIKEQPMKRVATNPEAPHHDPGAIQDVGFARTATGLVPVPSENVKERIEDNIIQETLWAIRNNVLPTLGFEDPPRVPLPPGQRWGFNPFKQEYEPQRWYGWRRFGTWAPARWGERR